MASYVAFRSVAYGAPALLLLVTGTFISFFKPSQLKALIGPNLLLGEEKQPLSVLLNDKSVMTRI